MKTIRWTLVTIWAADMKRAIDPPMSEFVKPSSPASDGQTRNRLGSLEPPPLEDFASNGPVAPHGLGWFEGIDATEGGRCIVGKGLSCTAIGAGDPVTGSSPPLTDQYRFFEVIELVIF
jgi:hypothetical protein